MLIANGALKQQDDDILDLLILDELKVHVFTQSVYFLPKLNNLNIYLFIRSNRFNCIKDALSKISK